MPTATLPAPRTAFGQSPTQVATNLAGEKLAGAKPDPFVGFVCKMLLTFFTVVAVDLVAVSLLTHQLRVWFPVWLDAQWATRSHPWVVYSQSYFAGIFFIPFLALALDRKFLRAPHKKNARLAFWILSLAVLTFILGWKGELMVRFGKQWEALGWLALTAAVWTALSLAERLPGMLAGVTPLPMLRLLARGVSIFFLVMAVLDPVLQLVVQGLAWSSGLMIEVGFFVPAGLALLAASRYPHPLPSAATGAAGRACATMAPMNNAAAPQLR